MRTMELPAWLTGDVDGVLTVPACWTAWRFGGRTFRYTGRSVEVLHRGAWEWLSSREAKVARDC